MPSASLILALFVLLYLLSPRPRLRSSRPRLTSKKSLLYFPYSVFKESAGAERAISLLRPPFDVKKIIAQSWIRPRPGWLRIGRTASHPGSNATPLNARPQGCIPAWESGPLRGARRRTPRSVANPAPPRSGQSALHSLRRRRVSPRPEMRTPSVTGGRTQLEKRIRRRPTFPRSCPRSIIGPERLNCRVRNGNGCGPLGKVTGKSLTW